MKTKSDYRIVKNGEKIRIAFLFQVASFWPSWESFYYSCVNDKRYEVRLFLIGDRVDTSKHMNSAKLFLEVSGLPFEEFSDYGFEKFYPHIAVMQTPYEYYHRKPILYSLRLKHMGIRVVYIPYGIELANTKAARHDHFRESVIRNAWRIYTLSDEFLLEYKKYCENSAAVRSLGLPRFDMLLNKSNFKLGEELEKKINRRKLIVWHTHFAKKIEESNRVWQVTPYLDEYVSFAERISMYEEDFFFLFLPHPRFGDDATDEENNRKSVRLLELVNFARNAYVYEEDDYRPALVNADGIITDRSALMVEAAAVGVPILYLKNPDYIEPLFPPIVPLMDSYYQGTGEKEMIGFVDMIIHGEDEKKSLRELALRKFTPFFDGKCAERIKEDIYGSINSDVSELQEVSPPKKIVIFGVGYFYKKIMENYSFPIGCEIIALSDNDSSKWGSQYYGASVVPPVTLNNIAFDKIIIMAGNVYEEEIYQQLRFGLEIPDNKIEYCEYISTL